MGRQARRKKERRLDEAVADDLHPEFQGVLVQAEGKNLPQTSIKSLKDVFGFFKVNFYLVLIIIILGIIGYANGLNGQFLSADDIPGIVNNPSLRDFAGTAKSLNLTSTYASAVVNIFGPNPIVFHTVALLLHLVNTLLVMLLSYLLFGKKVAFYASLIFCLLPSGSEAIFWIAGMGYLFQTIFSLVCLNVFFIYRSTGRKRFFWISFAVYSLGLILLQTPWLFIIPLMLVALDLFSGKAKSQVRSVFARWKLHLPYLVSTGLYWLVFMSGRFTARVTALVTDYYVDPYKQTGLIFRLPYTVYKTVELYLVPLRLSFFHEEALTQPVYYFMAIVTLLVFSLILWLLWKKSRYGVLMLAIIFSLAPTFSPVQVAWFIAERYLYLGGAFFAMMLGLLFVQVDKKVKIRNLAMFLLVGLLTLYTVRLVTRANVFKSSKTLWTATQQTAPTSYRVYNNLGDVYSNEQDWPKAIENFKKSIELAPDYADAIHNLGYTYMLMGDYDNAKKYLTESYEKNGRLWQALEKLGHIEYAQGNTEKAKEYFDKVRQANPQVQGLPEI